jgi:hypothetical protein
VATQAKEHDLPVESNAKNALKKVFDFCVFSSVGLFLDRILADV